MALKVICAGWSRTGTFSMRAALELLGIGRCYHMHEFFQHPEHVASWQRAASGADVDWDRLFDGYAAAGDAPTCIFWRELSEHYPQAKVVLTVRDPGDWYESMQSTVVPAMRNASKYPGLESVLTAVNELVLEGAFGGKFDERDEAIRRFRAHSAEIQKTIASDRLLVYEVAQGWGPLCAFLDLPVPNEPFPKTNSRESWRTRAARL